MLHHDQGSQACPAPDHDHDLDHDHDRDHDLDHDLDHDEDGKGV